MNVVECRELTKHHGRMKALENLSLTIEEDKITGLIGRNGAGKTTLLKILAGFWHESSGEVRVLSRRPFNDLLVSANTIFVDDQMNFPTALTLKEILIEAGQFYEHWDMELALRLFNYFSFDSLQIHSHLSKGKRSTFNMIIGLASRCPLTIFDEPTNGMDLAVRRDFYRALLKDYIVYPRSIIISSHYLDELEDVLEEILLIENGRAFLHMPIEEMKEYAVGLNGKHTAVENWITGREVIYTESDGSTDRYVVVKNSFTVKELDRIRLEGINVKTVPPSDLSVYLTNPHKGGIDDVFNRA
ncbi:ATP-binding cassette domain-containing protein [Virgibacillus kekensis]|uniref:ATP-binding cassette domain-containing protein n=1 Tax=Virgibacillus kekensis TaxID=202261 RepID=A0ABV9DMB4_9BACI